MEYRIIRQRTGRKKDLALSSNLMKQFGLSGLCADLLVSRGIADIDSAERYLYPSVKHLYDPFLFRDMETCCGRIERAVRDKERIVVYGDYDCDGVCASVILFKYLSRLGAEVKVVLPDRFSDGYGMNMERCRSIADGGCTLLITVDNGITAPEECAYLASRGVDVIVTDHHLSGPEQVECTAVLDAKVPGETYPFTELCGASVAMKVCAALGLAPEDPLYWELMAFAAVATVADVVPLSGENRTVAGLGLRMLPNVSNPGLSALMALAGCSPSSLSASDISFKIAPRINAAGRLESAMDAFELFTTSDPARARSIAEKLDGYNTERRKVEDDIIDSCEGYISEHSLLQRESILFICIEDAHEGVVGIAAGKIAEKYNRPCVVGSACDGIVKASARSIPSVNIHDMLLSASSLCEKFGGHSQAAGLTLREENFGELARSVNRYAAECGIASRLIRTVSYDMEAMTDCLSLEGIRQLEAFAPYGYSNPRPVMLMEGASLGNIRRMGSGGAHARLGLTCSGRFFSAVAFGMAEEMSGLDLSQKYDVVFTPSINVYRGSEEVQLEIKDLQRSMECPQEYYESLYDHFTANPGTSAGFIPPASAVADYTPEEAADRDPGSLFVVYGKDMFMRLRRYARYRGIPVNISYGTAAEYAEGIMNILVCPLGDSLPRVPLTVCDPPVFCGYESRFYLGREDAVFIPSERYIPDIIPERELIGTVYKKLPVLSSMNGDWHRYLDYINTLSRCRLNVFLLRICLDILSEMDIIEYEMSDNVLEVAFRPVEGTVDLTSSGILKKISGAYAKEVTDGTEG
ncbi:MAG: single-stranded-DNA-specific exonuclease RecJ [Eubacteriaceae bacterium]|nr:single-stranded-DNA-specific exonuclease RecJ [Eubacteriaceae bacterium]